MDHALVSPHDLANELASNQNLFLLDVREPEEFEAEHIEGATLIPLGEITSRASTEVPKDKDIVVICAHGIRSLEGLMALRMLGFDRSRSLHGGIVAWNEHKTSHSH